ncbi:Choline kinase [Spathaspora sp. JA1]|nr:Choline kinase [Spathaspora sp. JA1]
MSLMEITPSQSRSRSKSRTRAPGSSARSRSNSTSRRLHPRSLSNSSLNKLVITKKEIDGERTSIPSVEANLDNTLPLDFFKQDILAIAKTLKIHKWYKRQLTIANLTVTRISGALTNSIYKVEYQDESHTLPTLLLRVYGKNVDELIDRNRELETLVKLSQKRIGPRLLGIFTNGRFEQFLDGFNTLNKENIRDEIISQMLGRRMKDLHFKIELDDKDLGDLPSCWILIEKWLKIFENDYLPGYSSTDKKDIFWVDFEKFKQVIGKYKSWLFDHYESESFSSNYKFCHNDTQYGNLLLHESFNKEDVIVDSTPMSSTTTSVSSMEDAIKSSSNKKDSDLVVIDFEYSAANFPAFDIVNHFSEWMSDYYHEEKPYYIFNENYPTKNEQLNLIKAYVEYDFQFPSSTLKTSKTTEDLINEPSANLLNYEIEKLYNECIFWRASVQIYWCLWGLIQNGPITPLVTNGKSEEQGIDATYSITTATESLTIEDNDQASESITSSDDEFSYLKYSNQKVALIMGDLIQFGLIDKKDIEEKYWNDIKYLDCAPFKL